MNSDQIREELSQLAQGKHILSGGDLVDLGIFTHSSLSRLRKEGKGPPCLRLSEAKYVYPAKAFVEWLTKCYMNEKAPETDHSTKSAEKTQHEG